MPGIAEHPLDGCRSCRGDFPGIGVIAEGAGEVAIVVDQILAQGQSGRPNHADA